MDTAAIHLRFSGRIIMIGFGAIAQGTLPLLLRHVAIDPARIIVVTADAASRDVAAAHGVDFRVAPLTRDGFTAILDPLVGPGDFILNLSVDVSSVDLADYAMRRGALYLDTCMETWAASTERTHRHRTNTDLYREARRLRATHAGGPTAVLCHGANPGLVSHFVKRGLLDLAAAAGHAGEEPRRRSEWATLARTLGVRVIQISERDTQRAAQPRAEGEFIGTWSIDGLLGEGEQPAELGWGTHETGLPPDGRLLGGTEGRTKGIAVALDRPGFETRVRSWVPSCGTFEGMMLTHEEVISLSDYFSLEEEGRLAYRPTCFYAYRPCDDTWSSIATHEIGGAWPDVSARRILMDEITEGTDELGVLLIGAASGAYWYGSRLSIEEVRARAPANNATTLQVVAGVLSGLVWAIENPSRGPVHPEEMDFRRVLAVAEPYLGRVGGFVADWPQPGETSDAALAFRRFRLTEPARGLRRA